MATALSAILGGTSTARTTTFSVTRDDIIKAALRKLDVLGEGETPSTEDIINCSFALNLMLKSWEADCFYLWKVKEILVPMLVGVNTYSIGPTAIGVGALVTDRPMRLMDTCYKRDSSGLDTNLTILSRQEYNQLGMKNTSSPISQIFYDPQLFNGVLEVYGTPSDSTQVAYLTCQIPVYDFNKGTDVLDFPQEGYQAVVYGLADEMMDEYPKPTQQSIQRIMQKSATYREKLADFSQEETSIFLMPNFKMR